MGRSKELHHEVSLALDKLQELHPYMTMRELDMLVSNVVVYRNRAIIHGDNTEKRKIILPPDAPLEESGRRGIIFQPEPSDE